MDRQAMDSFDICIIGAGVSGLAIARQLLADSRYRGKSLVIIDQESGFGQHTSSRNSEVIHAGIYYPADSLKARFCVRGKQLLYDYCQQHGIAHRRLGKLILAQTGQESQLQDLQSRAVANGVHDTRLIGSDDIAQLEPDIRASSALLSPSSGIVDSHGFMQQLLMEAQAAGAIFAPLTRLEDIRPSGTAYEIECCIRETGSETESTYRFLSQAVINCAGLWANQVAERIGQQVSGHPQIPSLYYCRGDYFSYSGPARFTHLIYPVPEANTVGLGVHATLDLGGQIRFGPDTTYTEHIDYAVATDKTEQFAAAIRSYLPDIKANQLQPDYAGIRPKLAGPGDAAADFMLLTGNGEEQHNLVHLLGIESPGLTASLALAEEVTRRLCLA